MNEHIAVERIIREDSDATSACTGDRKCRLKKDAAIKKSDNNLAQTRLSRIDKEKRTKIHAKRMREDGNANIVFKFFLQTVKGQ